MRKRRILIVDDEVSFTRLLRLNLEYSGDYEIRIENNAERAVAAARDFRAELVLLDMMMPKMIGTEVAAAFRDDPVLQHTPIVFFTATVPKQALAKSGGIHAEYPCIAKPASVDEVLSAIERYMPPEPAEPAAKAP